MGLGPVFASAKCLDDAGCKRVYASLKLDIRKGRGDRLQGKVDTVRSRIGEIST